MATTNNGTIGSPIIDPSGSETTKQRRTIPLVINLPDNIIITSPIEDNITVSIESVELGTTTNTTPATQDYIVTLKIHQVISYCSRGIFGTSSKNLCRTYYETFIFPKVAGSTAVPNFKVTYDYDMYTNFSNLIIPGVARKYNKVIVVSVTNEPEATTPTN